MVKKIIIVLLICILCVNLNAQRIKYNFNPGWKVFVGDNPEASGIDCNDEEWKQVSLPYDWNENDAFKKDIAELSTGIAWYRKHFKIPASAKGRRGQV